MENDLRIVNTVAICGYCIIGWHFFNIDEYDKQNNIIFNINLYGYDFLPLIF